MSCFVALSTHIPSVIHLSIVNSGIKYKSVDLAQIENVVLM